MPEKLGLEVYTETELRFSVERGDTSEHTFQGQLLKTRGGAVNGQPIKVYINDTLFETYTTDATGSFSFTRDFDPEEYTVAYVIRAVYEGSGDAVMATFNATDFEGGTYTACTTLYTGFKPSTNSFMLTVEPQVTEVTAASNVTSTEDGNTAEIAPEKTSEELQAEAENNGWLEVWGPDSWSIIPPFFKYHARAGVSSLGLENQIWVGLFALGVDKSNGLCNLLQEALENLDAAARDAAVSAIIAMLASVYALFWLNAVAASLGTMTVAGYFATIILYTSLILAEIMLFYVIPDVGLSKALLYGVGFALLGMTLVAFWNDPQAQIFPSVLKQQLTGTDTVTTAARSILTFFLTAIATTNLLTASIIFMNLLMWPFAIITFVLGLFAIQLAQNR